jgi:protein TonB
MFEQSLLENVVRGGWKKALAVVISTTFQVFLLMVLVVMPLIFPESLPRVVQWTGTIIEVPQPPRPITDALPKHRPQGGDGLFHPPVGNEPRIDVPTIVPHGVDMRSDPMPPGDTFIDLTPVGGGGGNDPFARFISGLGRGPVPPPPPPPVIRDPKPEHKDPVRIGTLDPAKVVNHVQPNYPPLARQARIQGVVLLEAVISKTGRMERLHVISGHPLLVQAALDAVNQWRYMPTMLNGEPVEVITTIEVRFTLSQ